MRNPGGGQSSKPDRKTLEKNRRLYMKNLCSQLSSLIPSETYPSSTRQAVLESATSFINHLEQRVEELKAVKEEAGSSSQSTTSASDHSVMAGLQLPAIEVWEIDGSVIEVALITGLNNNVVPSQVIAAVEEEGAEVCSLISSAVGDKMFFTIHSKVKIIRVGVDTARLRQRLLQLVS